MNSRAEVGIRDLSHLAELKQAFEERFGTPGGTHLVHAPGRVNLMGDHIDYAGLSVLPMAIQRRVSVLYHEREDDVVRVASTDPAYPVRDFELAPPIVPYDAGDWGNYVKAAAHGLSAHHRMKRGFDAVVHSDLPAAAGLSSSSALVVAVALAMLHTNQIETERLRLAKLLADAERFVGTHGGGMDQAICLAARRHSASRIDFNPLRLTAHPIPPEWKFIVAFSLVHAPKSGDARETYNRRTVETEDARRRVTEAFGPSEVIDSYPALLANRNVGDLLAIARPVLNETLFLRFRHVVTEGERVRQAEVALTAYDLPGLGRLMTESHHSLRDDFEVSCPELDELVDMARRAGAAGARLTGAGLGGCVVALSTEKRAPRVLKTLSNRYYGRQELEQSMDDLVFIAEPSGGATVTAL